MIIAIDGPAASGKGTLGKRLAAHYGLRHLDTGLLYRAVAKALLDAGSRSTTRRRAVAAAQALDPAQFRRGRASKAATVGEAASRGLGRSRRCAAALVGFQRDFARDAARRGARRPRHRHGHLSRCRREDLRHRDRRRCAPAAAPLELAGARRARSTRPTCWPISAPRRARHAAGGRPAEAGAGCALARYHAFGYRRRIPGRHRHCRSRPSRPRARLTALSVVGG